MLLGSASCLYSKGDLDGAMEALSSAREIEPESPVIRYHMGLCEFGWKDYIEAADRFLEAVRLGLEEPLRADAEYHRGVSHYRIDEFDESLGALEAAQAQGEEQAEKPPENRARRCERQGIDEGRSIGALDSSLHGTESEGATGCEGLDGQADDGKKEEEADEGEERHRHDHRGGVEPPPHVGLSPSI